MELEQIQERYMSCLRSFVEHSAPQQPSRFHDLLVRLPEVSWRDYRNFETLRESLPRETFHMFDRTGMLANRGGRGWGRS